jgi:hypothetical protein
LGAPARFCASQRDGEETRIDINLPSSFFSQFPELSASPVPAQLDARMDAHTRLLLEVPIGRTIVRLAMPNGFFGASALIIFGVINRASVFLQAWFAQRREPLLAVLGRNEA